MLFIAIQKMFVLVGLLGAISGGVYFVDNLSWVKEQQGDSIIIKKMSGNTWTQMYEYDLQGRLLHYTWCDSQFQNHTISYDPETGEEIQRD